MKKIFLLLTIVSLAGCRNMDKENDKPITTKDSIVILPNTDAPASGIPYDSILADAKRIINLIKAKDFNKISSFVSTDAGLRFSSNSYITKEDLQISKEQVPGLWTNEKKYTWGVEEGSGEPIRKTFAGYYTSYIYAKDFAKAPEIEVNKTLRGNTTSITNFKEIYPESVNVDFHFPNTNEDTYDWATLRLIFIKENDRWYLHHIQQENYSL